MAGSWVSALEPGGAKGQSTSSDISGHHFVCGQTLRPALERGEEALSFLIWISEAFLTCSG